MPPPLINRTEEERTATDDEPLTCTAYARPECAPGDTALVQIWLHTLVQSAEVAQRAAESDAGARPYSERLAEDIPLGARLRFRFKAGKIPVEGRDEAEMTWEGRADSVRFIFNVPEEARPSRLVCAVTVYMEAMPLARLMFMVRIEGEKRKEVGEPGAPKQLLYRRAYLCYASEDRAHVLSLSQGLWRGLSRAGVHIMDGLTPVAGQDWREQTYRMIDTADLFYLFWSEAAARSEEVRREVLYALERRRNSRDALPEIVPVVVSTPMPPPPEELASLHFDASFNYLIAAEEALEREKSPRKK